MDLGVKSIHGLYVILCTGRLVEAYDELGNRYVLPKYCISRPTNMVGSTPQQTRAVPTENTIPTENEDSHEADSTTNLLQTTPPPPSGGGGASVTSGLRNRGGAATGGKNRKSKTNSNSRTGKSSGPPSPAATAPVGDPIVVKVRLSNCSKDIKMTLQASDRVRDMKRRLEVEHDVPASNLTMLYAGRVLNDRTYLKNLNIPRGFLIQAIVTT